MYLYLITTQYYYLKPTAACQTKASKRKRTGITGNTSTNGLNIANASGKYANNIVYPYKILFC